MTTISWVLLGAFVVVVALQFVNRILSALLGVLWTLALIGYAWQQMQDGAEIRFFFIRTEPRLFWPLAGGFFAYSVYVLVQAIRRRPTRPRREPTPR